MEFSALLVTATELETKCLHEVLEPRNGNANIEKIHEDNQTYFAGTFGKYNVLHVQCGMGSLSRNGSTLTISEAIRRWKPNAVIMLGIAFGVNEERQRIGDVLVSTSVVSYEQQRVSQNEVIQRGVATISGTKLTNRFLNTKDWIHKLPDDNSANIYYGMLLSGEKLIDNLEFKKRLTDAYPEAIGGEMEGAGVTDHLKMHHL